MLTNVAATMLETAMPASHGFIDPKKAGIAITLLMPGKRALELTPMYAARSPIGAMVTLAMMLAFLASRGVDTELMHWITYCVEKTAPTLPSVHAASVGRPSPVRE